MSHFSVIVATKEYPTEKVLEYELQPFHEFECTGVDDEFVQDIDDTEKLRSDWETDTTKRLRDPDGGLHEPWDDRFYRDPTPEESAKIGPIAGTGAGNGLQWSTKDWEDGKGYRTKVKFVPEGWEKVEVSRKETQTFREYVEGYCGKTPVPFGETPDTADREKHKYGYALLDENGEVVKVIDRTNPAVYREAICVGVPYTEGNQEKRPSWFSHLLQVSESSGTRLLRQVEEQSGRSIRILPSMHKSEERQPTGRHEEAVVHQGEVRADLGRVHGDTEVTRGKLCDLPGGSEPSGEAHPHRPLSHDQQDQGSPLPQLQLWDRAHEGQSSHTHCGSQVPHGPHVIGRVLISGTRWDYWRVGGRYCRKFIPKPGATGTKEPLSWEWEKRHGSNIPDPPSGVDVIRVGDMDKVAMKSSRVADRKKYLDDTVSKCGLPADKVDELFAQKRDGHAKWMALEEPRPRGKEYGEWLAENGFPLAAVLYEKCWDSPDVPAGKTADGWVGDAPYLTGFAFLRERKWAESGKMGWWGVVHGEKEAGDWEKEFQSLVDAVPDDWYLTVVDCHI